MRPYISKKKIFCHTHILPARKNLGVANGSNQISKQAGERKAAHEEDIYVLYKYMYGER